MERKSWNEIMQGEKAKANDEELFELWKFFGEKLLKDIGADADERGWVPDTQNGKKVYVWVGTGNDDDHEDAYDRAMGVI